MWGKRAGGAHRRSAKLKRAIILSAVAGAMLFVFAGAGVASAASATESAATRETQAPAQAFAGDSAEAPWEIAPPHTPDAGFMRGAPPAPNRFVLLSLALLGIAAIGAAAAFTGFAVVSRI